MKLNLRVYTTHSTKDWLLWYIWKWITMHPRRERIIKLKWLLRLGDSRSFLTPSSHSEALVLHLIKRLLFYDLYVRFEMCMSSLSHRRL